MAHVKTQKVEASNPKVETLPSVTSIKGTDSKMQCRGFQFEIGKTYSIDGNIKACESGFHACPVDHHPLSAFEFYAPAGNRFFECTQDGQRDPQNTKLASASITLNVELPIGDLVARCWDYVWSRAVKSDESHATGIQGAASATGIQGAASATGYQGAASATGARGAASATGYQGAASATGARGAASATGDRGAASATGYQGAASATGYQGAAFASGYEGKVKGSIGNPICAVERDEQLAAISVASGIVGNDGIKANIWYWCKNGKLVEVS